MADFEAFKFSVADCDAYFYTDEDEAGCTFCKKCASRIKGDDFPPRNIGKRRFRGDWGATYDGHLLITDRARDFLVDHNVNFHTVVANAHPKLYALFLDDIFRFDYKATGTRFLDFCDACQGYQSVVGTSPLTFSTPPHFAPMKLYQSDMRFATGREKGPVRVAGARIKALMASEFSELDFEQVIVEQ